MDMIAIPEFAMGAMENWGLVTYREVDLLIDPALATAQQKQVSAFLLLSSSAFFFFLLLLSSSFFFFLLLLSSSHFSPLYSISRSVFAQS